MYAKLSVYLGDSPSFNHSPLNGGLCPEVRGAFPPLNGSHMNKTDAYKTSELELASFLKAAGHALLGVYPNGRLVEFSFDASAEEAVERYFAGVQLSARELFEAHRSLRALIQQVREHQSHKNGSDTSWNQLQPRR